MAEVESIFRYPLTGGRAEDLEVAMLATPGIDGDRMFLLYEGGVDPATEKSRVSQKQLGFRQLATVEAHFQDGRTRMAMQLADEELVVPVNLSPYARSSIEVDEFGAKTDCLDAGDEAAETLARFFDKPTIRLAQKTAAWQAINTSAAEVIKRGVKPLHIVTTSSVTELQRRAENDDFGADRFRPNIVINNDGEEPFTENEWVGEAIKIGNQVIKILKRTPRCPTTGFNQRTGENKKDVPKLYRDLAKNDKEIAVFGVYGYLVTDQVGSFMISQGDPVSVE